MLSVEETTDLWNDGEDFRREMPSVSGGTCVAQRILRRWTTPKGFFKWRGWENSGYDVRENLLDKGPLWRIKVQLEAEAKQDEQVEECVVTPSYVDVNDKTEIRLDGFFSTKSGVFKFSMGITEAAGTLLNLQAAA